MTFNINRFKDIESQEFKVEIVTPMFLGGGKPNQAELRGASIKGVLRFWWRASCGIDNIADMQKKESKIFGSTETKSNVIINVVGNINKKTNFTNNHRQFLFRYMSYGVDQNREYFAPKEKFKLELRYPKEFIKEISNSVEILANYGGVGSKSRNGFGSIKLSPNDITKNNSSQKQKKIRVSLFGCDSLLMLGKVHNSWEKSLLEVGEAYKEAKSSLNADKMDKNFEKRKLIAKPIGSISERHAKPYFLHVSKLEDGQYQGQILYIPHKYCNEKQRDEYNEVCNKMNAVLGEKLRRQDDF